MMVKILFICILFIFNLHSSFFIFIACGGSAPSIRDELKSSFTEKEREISVDETPVSEIKTPTKKGSGGGFGLLGTTTETKTLEITPDEAKTVPVETPPSNSEEKKEMQPKETKIEEPPKEEVRLETYSGEPKEVAKKYFNDALSLLKSGDIENAKKRFESATENDDSFLEANYNLALIAYLNREYGEAKRYLNKCLKLNVTSIKVPVLLLKIYTAEGSVEEAGRILKELADKNAQNINFSNAYLRYLIDTKRAHEAVDIASNLLKKDEANVEIIKTMGMAYIALKKFDLAEFVLSNALQIKNDAEIYNLLGNIALYKDDKNKAKSHLKSAIELDPALADAHNNLGVIYDEAGNYEGAITEFKLAIKYFPKFAEATLNLGNSYRKNLEFGLARQTYFQAQKLDKNMAEVYFNLGILYIESTEVEDKEQKYNKAIEYLNKYKELRRGYIDRNDPVDKYIDEAKKLLKAAIDEKAQMKEIMQPKKEEQPAEGTGETGTQPELKPLE